MPSSTRKGWSVMVLLVPETSSAPAYRSSSRPASLGRAKRSPSLCELPAWSFPPISRSTVSSASISSAHDCATRRTTGAASACTDRPLSSSNSDAPSRHRIHTCVRPLGHLQADRQGGSLLDAFLPGRIRDSCPDQCVDIGIMFSFRLATIQMEPAMTRKTISTPKARARILLV